MAFILHIVSQMGTLAMFATFLAMAVVRYMSIYNSLLLDYAEEERTIQVIRALIFGGTVTSCLIDYSFAKPTGLTYQLLGNPEHTRYG